MLRTFSKIVDGVEVTQIVLRADDSVPDGDWRPVVVEGTNLLAGHREVRRETRIEPDRVVRVVITEPVIPTREEYGAAVEAHVDAVAVARGYSSAVSMLTYLNSGVLEFATEARAMRDWRDAVWLTVARTEAKVLAGQQPPPTIAGLIAALPPHPFT